MFRQQYVVMLNGSDEVSALGPFDSKAEALERGVEIVMGLGFGDDREDVIQALRSNTRNDVSVGKLWPPRAKVGLGAA